MATLSYEQAYRLIDKDHDDLIRIIGSVPDCGESSEVSAGCSPSVCNRRDQCMTDIRTLLHRFLYTSVAHFEREHVLMKQYNSRAHFERHSEEHGNMTNDINGVIRDFLLTQNHRQALFGIRQIGRMLEDHIATTDQEMREGHAA